MARTIDGIDGLRQVKGEDLGYSPWHEVTQEAVNMFAEATGDHQWIHVDLERAASGPFGGPIAHGYLTISLAPMLLEQVVQIRGTSAGINYGINKLRFPSPVPVGSRVRLGVKVQDVEDVNGGVQLTYALTFEVEGKDKPACVAEVLYRVLA